MRAIILAALTLLAGCQTYADKVDSLPMPADENARMEQCGMIRQEIARQNSAPAMMSGNAAIWNAVAAKNTAALENRAALLRCSAAFSDAAPVTNSIEQCIAACKANTSRTPEQCFDSCRAAR